MAKKWRKKKNTMPYFARIDAGRLDISDGLVADLLVATHGGELQASWPNASLQNLQDFLAKLVSDIVRAGSGPIQLGAIEYFEQNAKGKPEETGLSWDSPLISSDFENFVVSTANDLFNNQSTRQDESITYDMICEALDGLQKAALTYTKLEADDMPVYPTAKAFQQARHTGEELKVSSKRLTLRANPSVDEKASVTEQPIDPTPSTRAQPAPDDQKAQEKPEAEEIKHSEMDKQQGQAVTPQQQPSAQQMEVPEHPIERILRQVHLNVPYFELSEPPQDNVPASSPAYVGNQINRYKQESNQFLDVTKETFLAKIGESLSKQTEAEQKRHEQALNQLKDSQWETKLERQLAEEKSQESQRLFQARQQEFKSQYDRLVAQEKQRHEQALDDLQVTFQNQLDDIRPQIDADLQNWYEIRSHELHETYRSELVTMVEETRQLHSEQLMSALSKTANELVGKFNEYLANAQEKTTDELERRRQVAEEEHVRAVRLENQTRQTANQSQSLADLQGQVDSLNETVRKITDERDEQHQQFIAAQARYERLNDQVINTANQTPIQPIATTPASASADTSALIKAYESLFEEKARNASLEAATQKTGKKMNWRAGIVGMVMVALVGGVGTLVVNQHQLSANYQSLAKENQELKNVQTQKTTSSSASQTANSSASSSQPVDRPYEALDDSLKRNSLDIYRQSFADNQLGQNSYRVFRVGQLLNQQVGRDEALAVAKANPGYNQKLNQYLGV
ncbi:hypothetical protein [Fructobacillus tropaeoli]|uniref:hypothetical protein n=1 Tax=Fructobacillus tropaeoli TaxID=709323 RepID=UPI002D88ABA7|nr:hypothetical protein LMG30238_FMBOGHMB_01601 [Fructobacillus tropaeoli]